MHRVINKHKNLYDWLKNYASGIKTNISFILNERLRKKFFLASHYLKIGESYFFQGTAKQMLKTFSRGDESFSFSVLQR